MWFVPEVGCARVGTTVCFKSGEVNSQKLLTFTIGEPDPSLFLVPDSFTELPPSKFALANDKDPHCKSCAAPADPLPIENDAWYWAHRPKPGDPIR
jgi:hypothetical protein